MGNPPLPNRSPIALMVVAISTVIASYTGANVYSQYNMRRVDKRADVIALDHAPRIEHLTVARAASHHLYDGVVSAVWSASEGRRVDWDSVARAWKSLQVELGAYSALPLSREFPLYAVTVNTIRSVRGEIDSIQAALQKDDLEEARRIRTLELAPALDRLDTALEGLVALHADEVRALSQQIARDRRNTGIVSYVLHSLSAILAIGLLFVLLRALRHHSRVQAERNALAERRASELEQFAGRVAHDIKGPLGTMSLRIALTERRNVDDRTRECLSQLTASVHQIDRILQGLLDFAQAGGEPQEDARASLEEILAEVAADVQATIDRAPAKLSIAPCPGLLVACPPGVLTSILENLLRNAAKYVVEGTQSEHRIAVRAYASDEFVRIEVADNGPGIPRGQEQRIFEPYARGRGTQQPGIGLGLATVKRLVEGYRGRVGVDSDPKRGSCFWVELLVAKPGAAEPVQPAEADVPVLH